VNIYDAIDDEQKAAMPQVWSRLQHHFTSLGKSYFEVVFATACWLIKKKRKVAKGKFFVGISGGQGSGKSTFSNLLGLVLTEFFFAKTCVMSLDDFYLRHDERLTLAKNIHPLLKTRGVPGTHDLDLLEKTLSLIKDNKRVQIPKFDKSQDDRGATLEITSKDLEIVIMEGWCWGATPESDTSISLNQLEKEQDADGAYRHYVNQQLMTYQDIFLSDASIFLSIPDMSSVLEWRGQQERELRDGPKRMTKEEIAYFVMHYERLTRHMLQTMPNQVDLTLYLNNKHEIEKAILKKEN
jgi:D-glycerate 3-kinase